MKLKTLFTFLAIFALLAVSSVAQTCTDPDNGGERDSHKASLIQKTTVDYGITDFSDVCLTGKNGVSTEKGSYLREYFCNAKDRRDSKVYNCVTLGYTDCRDGACYDSSKDPNSTATKNVGATQKTISSCGNKIMEKDKGEECDPPGSICFGRTTAEYGTCQSDCKCKVSAAALANRPAPTCGDTYVDSGEDCEADSDCDSGSVCSSCSCVKTLSPEEIAAMTSEAKESSTADNSQKKSVADSTKTESTKEKLDLSTKNFSQTPGIKATSGISKFFKGIFSFIANLFS